MERGKGSCRSRHAHELTCAWMMSSRGVSRPGFEYSAPATRSCRCHPAAEFVADHGQGLVSPRTVRVNAAKYDRQSILAGPWFQSALITRGLFARQTTGQCVLVRQR
jgi:hypothetical protein